MKKILTGVALAALIFAACSKENGTETDTRSASGVAYLSIRVATQNPANVRSSDEDDGITAESTISKLYLITFNDAGAIVKVPGKTTLYNEITGSDTTPEAVKIAASSTQLVVIANPGGVLKDVLDNLTAMSTVNDLKAAIAGTELDIKEIQSTAGFTMITSGSDVGKNTGDVISTPYVPIDNHIHEVTATVDDATAKTNAETTPLPVVLERLASKMMVYKGTPNTHGATFTLDKWTVDAVNSTFYPFADKTILGVSHTAGYYTKNFYTQDPNFTNNNGILYASVDEDTFAPTLITHYDWMDASTVATDPTNKIAYTIENTMHKDEQKFKNATRIVMQATYFPNGYTPGQDWFRWANVNYPSLGALQIAYNASEAGSNIRTACDNFFSKIEDCEGVTATGFATLTPEMLDEVDNGGERVKDGTTPVIRWFQKGLCYYYYEIRHDNETSASMAFGKYGVVRNNWYNLAVNDVSGPGTPWYPDIIHPGEGDPDPNDPIDDAVGYIGISVQIAPWIIWQNNMNI